MLKIAPPSHDHKIDAKIDQNISDRQRFSSRYSVDWSFNGVANLVGNPSFNGNPGTARSQNFIMDYTRTQNASTIFTARRRAPRRIRARPVEHGL